MRADDSEIDQDDHHAYRDPIAEDGEGPCITGIPYEDQTADRTAFELDPSGKQPPFAAVRAAFAQSASKRRADQFRAGRHYKYRSRANQISDFLFDEIRHVLLKIVAAGESSSSDLLPALTPDRHHIIETTHRTLLGP